MPITLTLVERSLHNETTPNGVRVLEAVDLLEHNTRRRIGVGIFTHEVMNPVATEDGLDTAMAHMNLIFFAGVHLGGPGGITGGAGGAGGAGGGGGGGQQPTHPRGQAPENMTLDGSDFFATPPAQGRPAVAPTACIGSVSAASPLFAGQIGRQFRRQGNTLEIL